MAKDEIYAAGQNSGQRAGAVFLLMVLFLFSSASGMAQNSNAEDIRRFDSINTSLRKAGLLAQELADSMLARILNEAPPETASHFRYFDSAAQSLLFFYEQMQSRFLARCGSRDGLTLPEEMMARREQTDSFFIQEGNGILVFERKEAFELWKGPVEQFTPETLAQLQPKGKALKSYNARIKLMAEYVLTRLPAVSAIGLFSRFKNDLQNLRLKAYNEYLSGRINKTQ